MGNEQLKALGKKFYIKRIGKIDIFYKKIANRYRVMNG